MPSQELIDRSSLSQLENLPTNPDLALFSYLQRYKQRREKLKVTKL